MHYAIYTPLAASSYIPTPAKLRNPDYKLINIKNNDIFCFKYCIDAYFHPASDHVDRVNNYTEHIEKYNWDGLSFPMSIKQIDKFENNNINISINIFGFEKEVYPLRITKYNNRLNHINLLYITSEITSH